LRLASSPASLLLQVDRVAAGLPRKAKAQMQQSPHKAGFVLLRLVEPGGFEPPSASTPLSVLHA